MDLTLDQALQKGVEAHKAGKVQEADRYYTAILKANPKHPDANHNMGVLAVGVGKVDQALPFFKTALEANPKIAQFWLSYVDALIKLNRMDDAKSIFDKAKSHGAKGDGFDKLEQKLGLSNKPAAQQSSDAEDPPQDQLQSLAKLYSQKKLKQVFEKSRTLTIRYTNNLTLWNLMGASAAQIGQLDEAVNAFKRAIDINPNSPEIYYNMGNVFKDQGKLDEAITAYEKAITLKPNLTEAYSSMGIVLASTGKLDEAIEFYNKALNINPKSAKANNRLGNALSEKGQPDKAIEAYNKAISLQPDFAEAYNNLGNALKEQGKLEVAIEAYTRAISIKPNYAEAFYNMGNALQQQGKLEVAIEAYTKAISIKPNYAEAYTNMGNALQQQGKLEVAIEAYTKAISIKPNYAEAYWNLSGTSENIREAKTWIVECLEADPNHLKAKLTLGALQFYEGDRSYYNALLKSSQTNHPFTRSFDWAFSLNKLPPLHFHRWAFFDHMIDLSKKDRPFYEFGVWRGEAFRYLIKTLKKGYGFDTFEGLPENWHDEKAGTYSSDSTVPKIKGGKFIVGKFEDTLPNFFAVKRPVASIINFDADLYSSTICALNFAKPVIDQHTILIFDEFIINKNWEQDEYKALEEFCSNNDYTYEVLAISFFTKQVAVKIIGI